jgi:hypothetical protein
MKKTIYLCFYNLLTVFDSVIVYYLRPFLLVWFGTDIVRSCSGTYVHSWFSWSQFKVGCGRWKILFVQFGIGRLVKSCVRFRIVSLIHFFSSWFRTHCELDGAWAWILDLFYFYPVKENWFVFCYIPWTPAISFCARFSLWRPDVH